MLVRAGNCERKQLILRSAMETLPKVKLRNHNKKAWITEEILKLMDERRKSQNKNS